MIDSPKFMLGEKRMRYGVYMWGISALLAIMLVGLEFVDPIKYALRWTDFFVPVALGFSGWMMRLSGRHDMRAEREAK